MTPLSPSDFSTAAHKAFLDAATAVLLSNFKNNITGAAYTTPSGCVVSCYLVVNGSKESASEFSDMLASAVSSHFKDANVRILTNDKA